MLPWLPDRWLVSYDRVRAVGVLLLSVSLYIFLSEGSNRITDRTHHNGNYFYIYFKLTLKVHFN